MQPLDAHDFASARPLFAAATYARSFPFAVLDGHHAGSVTVDAEPPTAALVALMAGFHVFGGDPANAAFLREAAAQTVRRSADEYVLFLPLAQSWRAPLEAALDGYGAFWAERLEFTLDPGAVAAHGDWRARLPSGGRLLPYDRGLTASAPGVADFWGGGEAGIDRFLAHGLGCALLLDGEVVCRAHTVFVGDGIAETSIETEEPHRRRGYALTTTLAYLEWCSARSLRPSWSCWAHNAASQALAAAVGFAGPVAVPVLVVKKGGAGG